MASMTSERQAGAMNLKQRDASQSNETRFQIFLIFLHGHRVLFQSGNTALEINVRSEAEIRTNVQHETQGYTTYNSRVGTWKCDMLDDAVPHADTVPGRVAFPRVGEEQA
ncbi:unnamed protein product [Arctogadus glacialis]